MKIIPVLSALSLLCAGTGFARAQTPARPTITMSCFNPDLTVKFTSVQGSQASTEPVQFNVNIPAGKGTIFVNENNHGICNARISDGFQFTGGSGQIDPTQVSVSDPHKPANLTQSISIVPKIQGNQMMMFEVISNNSAIKGNLNIRFIAKYKAD